MSELTPFLAACRDAAGQYGPNAGDLPAELFGKLQAMALVERYDWSDLCSTPEVERARLELLGWALEYRADKYARLRLAGEILSAVDDLTYGDVMHELEDAYNKLTEEQDEIARDDARMRARDMKASA